MKVCVRVRLRNTLTCDDLLSLGSVWFSWRAVETSAPSMETWTRPPNVSDWPMKATQERCQPSPPGSRRPDPSSPNLRNSPVNVASSVNFPFLRTKSVPCEHKHTPLLLKCNMLASFKDIYSVYKVWSRNITASMQHIIYNRKLHKSHQEERSVQHLPEAIMKLSYDVDMRQHTNLDDSISPSAKHSEHLTEASVISVTTLDFIPKHWIQIKLNIHSDTSYDDTHTHTPSIAIMIFLLCWWHFDKPQRKLSALK